MELKKDANIPLVSSKVDSRASIITLNNSADGNVLNIGSMTALRDCLAAAAKDDDTRVIVLRSDGPVFCMGMDFSMLLGLGTDKTTADKAVSLYVEILTTIHSLDKPVVCVLKGDVKAGGVGLAAACDIVLASEDATFEFSEIFFGLIPANVIPFVCSLRITSQKVRYLVLTAKKVGAAESLRLGLIDEVFTKDELEKGVRGVMKNLFRASPDAMRDAKKFTDALSGTTLSEGSRLAREKLLEMIARPEVIDAIRNFREGVSPGWFERFKPENPVS